MQKQKYFGFTLVGLIISLAILGILTTAVFIAVNPVDRVDRAKDLRRQQDIVMLAKALKDYSLNHQGQLPFIGDISNRKRVLCSETSRLTCADDTDACLEIDTTTDFLSSYLTTMPIDPDKTSLIDSGYYIEGDPSTGQLTIGACEYEQTEVTQAARIRATVLDCGTEGIAYNGSCWYLSQTVAAKDCAWFCTNDYSLTCDDTVTPTINSCELNGLFAGVKCSSCTNTNGSGFEYSPGVGTALTTCFEDSEVGVCSGATVSSKHFPICPCH